jgi:hypothetical protein
MMEGLSVVSLGVSAQAERRKQRLAILAQFHTFAFPPRFSILRAAAYRAGIVVARRIRTRPDMIHGAIDVIQGIRWAD